MNLFHFNSVVNSRMIQQILTGRMRMMKMMVLMMKMKMMVKEQFFSPL